MRALVLGGYGAVGAETVAELRSAGDTAFAAGRDPSRADRVITSSTRPACVVNAFVQPVLGSWQRRPDTSASDC